MKSYVKSDKIAVSTFIIMALYVIGRGTYWSTSTEKVVNESPLYIVLHEILPIYIWGLLFVFSGLCFLLAAVFYPKVDINNRSNNFLIIGGTLSGIIHVIMAASSISNSSEWFFPYQYCVFAMLFFYLAFMGGSNRNGKR